jgi:hypothetical protein
VIIKDPHLTKSDAEEQFAAWLATQRNANGQLFKSYVANGYARNLRTEPPKLDISLSLSERDVFSCRSVDDFDKLNRTFRTAFNFRDVNTGAAHGAFSAGLAAYRRFVQYIERNGEPEMQEQETSAGSAETSIGISPAICAEPQHVDFSHPEYCTGSAPVSCFVEGNDFSGGNWRDLLVALTESFLLEKPKASELYDTSIYQGGEYSFILREKPKYSARQLSNGCWINVNLSVKDLVLTIGRLCRFCGVRLEDVDIRYVPKQSAGGYKSMIKTDNSARFAQQTVRDAFRVWLIKHNPEWSSGTITMHYSDAYYLYNNARGISLEEALTADDGLQRAYDAIEQFYTANPKQTNNPSGSARGYLRSLRMLKEFIAENHSELLTQNGNKAVPATAVPDELIESLNHNYATGFRFETTYISLLSNAAGIEVDEKMQAALKRIMFRRDDDVYFLLDVVAEAVTRKDIVDFADSCLEEYGCFEIPEFYKLYEDKVNPACIRNAADFESFYEQIGKGGVRCVQAPYVGNRIARYSSGSVWGTFNEVAAKIVAVISEEYYGSCNEDDLHTKFCVFSTDLLGKIIKQCAADDLIRVEINDSVCYQTYDALGLPDDFSEQLAETLERLDEIGLTIYRDALHTALSLKLGMNFMAEFNLPDWDAFQRLTAAYYKTEPHREWRHYIFGEVTS